MSRPTDISIDLETLGTSPHAAILSIGAAAFNRDTGLIGPTYYASINLADALKHGSINADTLQWWAVANTEVFKRLLTELNKVTLYEALRGLSDLHRAQPANVCVWGNGATFDISILEHAYDAVDVAGFTHPWKYWDVRDLRTLIDQAKLDKSKVVFEGVPHHALSDAIHQAKLAIHAFGNKPKLADNSHVGYMPKLAQVAAAPQGEEEW